jgi:hypothetical protein
MLHLVNSKTHVARPVEGILEIGSGALHCLQRLLIATPHCVITAQVLHVDRDVPGTGPVSAQIGIAFT